MLALAGEEMKNSMLDRYFIAKATLINQDLLGSGYITSIGENEQVNGTS